MRRITIERNKHTVDGQSAGNISGETDDGRRWILFLDEHGAPQVFWPERTDDGAVVGDSIDLQDKRVKKFLEIVNMEDPLEAATRLRMAAESVERFLNGDPDAVAAVERVMSLRQQP